MISIVFTETDGAYTLTDAIVLPDDHKLSDEQIEQMKKQRFADWVVFITTPPPEEATTPPEEEVQG
jgi:hypothetical protein